MRLPSPKARTRILWTVVVADLFLLALAYALGAAGHRWGLLAGISVPATVSLVASLWTVTRDRDGRPR
jgi:hypothetical protein